MKNKKRMAAMVLAASMALTAFAGCGSTQETKQADTASDTASGETAEKSENTEASATKEAKESITLTIAARGGSHVDVIEAVKEKYEEEHNVKIEVLGLEADDLKQKVSLDASNPEGAYDLVMVDDPVMPEFADAGVLLDLTENGYEDDSDFVEASLAVGKNPYGTGDTYALPFAGNVQLFFYNEEVLKELGAEVPTSWEEVLETATKAKEAGKNGYVIRGQQGNPIVSDYLPILWAYGGDVFDDDWNVTIDSEEAKEALEMYCDLLAQGVNYEKNDIVSSVADGSSAMALGWPSWFISGEDAQAAYAEVPAKVSSSAEECQTGMIGNWMMGVAANSTHKEEAIELLKYLTSEEVQKEAVDKGGVPTRTSVFTDTAIIEKYPYFATIYEGTKNSVVRPRTEKWSNVEEALGIELSNVISGVKTVEEGLADAKTAIEDIMK
ncbi:MAG: ABC transporter substrate-binding protein [Lachnospiraceae bacterium]|nr:ABC transporter substrate-binding protein [Lachnospiraceae bacterium]